jgi:nucleoside-diphosphate-sugar epimerase
LRILVTGAGGYIGSVLSEMLTSAGYDVICLDRFYFGEDILSPISGKVRIVKDDIRTFHPSLLKGVDAVLDLASLSNDPTGELDPAKTFEINYKGRVRVAQLSKKYGVKRYILASTCSVYGASDSIADESSPLNPLTTYAKANTLAEKEVLTLGDDEFTVTALRQATVYGLSRRMRFDLAINGMILALYKTKKVKIMRDGTQWRPFVHVRDTSRAFMKVLESERELVNRQIFNVGSNEQNYRIFELAKMISESLKIPFDYEWYGSPDTRNYRVSFDKARNELGFIPSYTPREASIEIWNALQDGRLDPDDPRWITVNWYKRLLDMHRLIKKVELNGEIL